MTTPGNVINPYARCGKCGALGYGGKKRRSFSGAPSTYSMCGFARFQQRNCAQGLKRDIETSQPVMRDPTFDVDHLKFGGGNTPLRLAT